MYDIALVLRWEGPFTMPDMVLTIAAVRIVVDVQLTTTTVMIFMILRPARNSYIGVNLCDMCG